MHLVGRFERVRQLGPQGWGLPFILDRKRQTLSPFRCEEWWQSPAGVWLPVIAGGVGLNGLWSRVAQPRLLSWSALNAVGTFALNGAYTAGGGGTTNRAVAVRVQVPVGKTLSKVYFYLSSFTGTAANVNDLNLELRSDDGGERRPNTTAPGLLESKTYDPASATGWHAVTGWTTALTAGTVYWIVLGDADGDATDYATVLQHFGANLDLEEMETSLSFASFSTVDGFATVGTSAARVASFVLVFTDGTVLGVPFSSSASMAASTLQRGLHVTNGLSETLRLWGAQWTNFIAEASYSAFRIWEGATGPTGSPWHTSTAKLFQTTVGDSRVLGAMTDGVVTLAKATEYSFVAAVSASSNGGPAKNSIGTVATGAIAELRAAMFADGGWHWREEQAGSPNTWGLDDINVLPSMALLVDDQVAVAGGRPFVIDG